VSGVSATEIAPGVHRLGTEWVNWYLVEAEGKVTVVDTALPGYYPQLERALEAMGRAPGDIEAVVLTHSHNDHLGCAERIRAGSDARVLAPAGEAAAIRGEAKPGQPAGLISNLWRPVLLRFMAHAVKNGGAKFDPVTDLATYEGEEELDVPGRPRAIPTPGHSPAHHSLHFPGHGVLFTGDAMASVSWISGNTEPQLHPFGEDRARMPAALDALEPVAAEVVAFGHGEPFHGSPADAVASARGAPSASS
jgi:glyoxylase-like metal-dependent hydrolase (beta-lactamase superfamily II)